MEQKMKWSDLIVDPGTGMYSHTKIWTNIAYIAVTIAFIKSTFDDAEINISMWLVYLAIVGGHSSLSKLISMKYK